MRIHHLALLVEDLAGAERFYAEVLGLPVTRRWPDDDGSARSVWLDAAGALLMLERTQPGGSRRGEGGGGFHLLALAIPSEARDAWRTRLEEAGHPPVRESEHSLYVLDPEGNEVALSHWPD